MRKEGDVVVDDRQRNRKFLPRGVCHRDAFLDEEREVEQSLYYSVQFHL